MKNNKFIVKTAIIVTIFSMMSKALGFVKEMVTAYYFGTSDFLDAYLIAVAIPTIFFGWISAISISYTTIGKKIFTIDGEEEFENTTRNINSYIMIVGVLSVMLCVFLSGFFVKITAPGVSETTSIMAKSFTKVLSINVIINVMVQMYIAYLNCKDLFFQSSVSMLANSGIQIIFVILAGTVNIYFLVIGNIIANGSYLLLLLIFAKKSNHKFGFNFKPSFKIKEMFILACPIFISNTINEINIYVDKVFSSLLGGGSISALSYAGLYRNLFVMLINTGISTVSLPTFSKLVAEKEYEEIKIFFGKCIDFILMISIPLTFGIVMLSNEFISVLMERGAFDRNSTLLTAGALIMYALGVGFVAIRDIAIRVLYSLDDTKSPMYIGIGCILINILLNSFLYNTLGIKGIALSTSISAILTLPFYFRKIRKKIGSIRITNFLKKSVIYLIATFSMVLVIYGLNKIIKYSIFGLLLKFIVSVTIYFSILLIFGAEFAIKVKEFLFKRK